MFGFGKKKHNEVFSQVTQVRVKFTTADGLPVLFIETPGDLDSVEVTQEQLLEIKTWAENHLPQPKLTWNDYSW